VFLITFLHILNYQDPVPCRKIVINGSYESKANRTGVTGQCLMKFLLGPHTQLATAWIALSESKEENGCVRFIPGSNSQVKQKFTDQSSEGTFNSFNGFFQCPVPYLPYCLPEI
jgi:hypothetical protein